MVQRGSRPSFLLEAAQTIWVGTERGGKDLDGDVAPEPGVASAKDFAHSAGPSGEVISYGPKRRRVGALIVSSPAENHELGAAHELRHIIAPIDKAILKQTTAKLRRDDCILYSQLSVE